MQQMDEARRSHDQETAQMVLAIQQLQATVRAQAEQLKQQQTQMKQLQFRHDELAQGMDVAEKTRRRLVQDNETLRGRLVDQLKDRPDSGATPKPAMMQDVENAVRQLYKDIYNVELGRPAQHDEQAILLVEAISHVQRTYNQDMEAASRRISLLNSKLARAQLK